MKTDVRRQKVQDSCVQNSRSWILSRLELRAAFPSCSVPLVISYIVSPPRSPLTGKTLLSRTMSLRCVFVCVFMFMSSSSNRVPFVISNIVSPPHSPLSDLIVPVPQVTPVSNVFEKNNSSSINRFSTFDTMTKLPVVATRRHESEEENKTRILFVT